MTTPEAVRRRQRIADVLDAVILAVLAFLLVYQLFFINPDNATTKDALCHLRADVTQRVAASRAFLTHPERFDAFNDPKILALARAQVESEERTVDALSVLDC